MAITVPNQWTGTASESDLEIKTAPTSGNWLIAVVSWRTTDGSAPSITVGDLPRNIWEPIGTSDSADGSRHMQVWLARHIDYSGWEVLCAYVAACQITASDVGTVTCNIFEGAGLSDWLTVDSVTVGTASAATTFSIVMPAPSGSANCLMVAGAAVDNAAATVTVTSAGWTALTQVSRTGPDVRMAPAWRTSTATQTPAWSSSVAANWVGIAVAIKETGTAVTQPNANYPYAVTEIALGYDMSTPHQAASFVSAAAMHRSLRGGRGLQAELGDAQTQQTALLFDDPLGSLDGRPSVSATASAAGTTTTIAYPDAGTVYKGDYFRIVHGSAQQNTGFESGLTGWAASGGTASIVTATVHSGTQAAQLVPDGVSSQALLGSSPRPAVAAGVAYTASAWVYCAVSRSVGLNVGWWTAGASLISTSSASVSVTANTWTLITAVFTAPATAATANIAPVLSGTPPAGNVLTVDDVALVPAQETTVFRVTALSSVSGTATVTYTPASAAPAAAGDVLTTTPLDLNTPWRERALWGGKWWPVDAGWVGDFTQTYTQGEGLTQIAVNGVDALKLLAVDSPTALRGEIARRSPTHWWPLDGPAGGGTAQNLSGYSTAQLVQVTSKFGAGSGSADFGAATQNIVAGGGSGLQSLLGDNGTAWRQQGLIAADVPTKGFALVGTDSLFPAIAGGVTIFGAVTAPVADQIGGSTADPTLMILRNADPGDGVGLGSIIKIAIDKNTSQYKVVVWDQATHAQTATVVGGGLSNGWLSWAVTFDRTSWSCYSGGVLLNSGSANLAALFTRIDVGGEADQFFNGQSFNAYHTHIAVFGRRLSATELSHMEAAQDYGALGGEHIETRMMRKLNTAGWRGGRVIATSGLPVGAEPTDTDTLLGKLSKTAGYEDGIVFADALAQVQYRSRLASYHQVSRATLGELTGSGEIPFLRDVQRNVSPVFLYNIIRIANSSLGIVNNAFTLQASTAVAANSASAAKYSPGSGKAFDRDTRLANQADAFALACWLLARYATPMRRISSLTIDAAALAATIPNVVWPFVLGVEIGDLVTVNRRPVGAPPSSQQYRVLNVQHDRAAGKWLTTLTLGIAPATSLVLGDPVKGILGNNAMAA